MCDQAGKWLVGIQSGTARCAAVGVHTHQQCCYDQWGCPDPTLCFSREAGLWVNLLSLAGLLELTLNVLTEAFPILTGAL